MKSTLRVSIEFFASAALPLRPPAPDTRQPSDNPVRASRMRRTPLTPSSGDTTYPVPSIQVTAQEQDMSAPPNIDPVTAHSDSDVVHWLTNDTRDERFIDNVFAELCVRLQRAGHSGQAGEQNVAETSATTKKNQQLRRCSLRSGRTDLGTHAAGCCLACLFKLNFRRNIRHRIMDELFAQRG